MNVENVNRIINKLERLINTSIEVDTIDKTATIPLEDYETMRNIVLDRISRLKKLTVQFDEEII